MESFEDLDFRGLKTPLPMSLMGNEKSPKIKGVI